jgi:hypothetical protein
MPKGASVPALGLSNKAIFEEEKREPVNAEKKPNLAEDLYKEVYFSAIDLNSKKIKTARNKWRIFSN